MTPPATDLDVWTRALDPSAHRADPTPVLSVDDMASSVPEVWRRAAAQHQDRVAIEGPATSFSYAELDERATGLARAIAEVTVPGDRAVILTGHTEWTIVTVLACLHAGVVVLNPDIFLTPDQQAAQYRDARPAVAVGPPGPPTEQPQGLEDVILLAADATADGDLPQLTADDPAYLIYTSGTVGRPKGAVLTHTCVLHIAALMDVHHMTTEDRWPMIFPLSTSANLQTVLGPLFQGATLVVGNPLADGLPTLVPWVAEHRPTMFLLPPTLLRLFADMAGDTRFPSVREMLLAGERIDPGDVLASRRLFGPGCTIVPTFASTETGPLSWCFLAPDAPFGPDDTVPSGFAVPRIDIEITDPDGRAAEVGAVGEIVVHSPYLAAGYWNGDTLSIDPFPVDAQGARIHRTGDLGRVVASGHFQLVGRADHQVKVLGMRVHLGAVEVELLALDDVTEAVVVADEDARSTTRLTAYLQTEREDVDRIRRYLRTVLPRTSIPERFIAVTELPRLANGKVDRRGLAPAIGREMSNSGSHVEPADDVEFEIVRMIERTLDTRPVSVTADLDDLGLDSLQIAGLLVEIEEQFDRAVPMAELLETRTARDLAAIVRDPAAAPNRLIVPIQPRGDRPPMVICHDLTGSAYRYRHLADALGWDQPMLGFESPLLTGFPNPFASFADLTKHYAEALDAAVPDGPLHLTGWSFGGLVIYEVAVQLLARGRTIASLVMIDIGPDAIGGPGARFPDVPGEPKPPVDHPGPHRNTRERMSHYVQRVIEQPRHVSNQYFLRRMGLSGRIDRAMIAYDLRRHHQVRPGNRLWYTWREHAESLRGHRFSPYPGDLHLIRAGEGSTSDIPDMGWGEIVGGTVQIREIPGHHDFLMDPPGVGDLADTLRDLLDRSLRGIDGKDAA